MASELTDIDLALSEGDHPAFDAVAERHRRELQAHCYRMLGSLKCDNQLAAASYVRAPGEGDYARLSLDVLRIEDGVIAEIITFPESVFDDFGSPEKL